MGTTAANLYGRVSLGGGELELSAALGGGKDPVFRGSTAAPVDFTGMVRDLLGSAFNLDLPAGFPTIVFEELSAVVAAGKDGSASFEASSNVSWDRPFGLLESLSLTGLRLSLSAGGAAPARISFSSGVRYGSLVDLKGYIAFSGGRLQVAGIDLAQPLSIGDFLSWSVPGLDWGGLLPISLGPRPSAEAVRLYYARDGLDSFLPGFNVDRARISVLGFSADVSLSAAGKAVSVTGSVEKPIDFGFIRFYGPDDPAASPLVEVKCAGGERWFRLRSGVDFLDKPFGDFSVGVVKASGKPDYQFEGDIRYQGKIGPFQDPAFGFTWSRAAGFRVAKWPIPDFPGGEYLDYVKALNQLPSKGCATFVKDMFRSLINTRFNFEASLDSPQAGGGEAALNFTVKGSYTVSARGTSDILTVPLPADLRVSLGKPADFNFDALAAALGKAIEEAAAGLLQQIVDDPGRSAKFFTIVIAQAALPQVLAMLACRNWPPPPSPPPPPPPPPGPPPPIPPVPPLPPPKPTPQDPGDTTLLSCVYENGAMKLAWTEAARASSYRVLLRNNEDMASVDVGGLEGRITFPQDWPATTYGVNVQGLNGHGRGHWSNVKEFLRLGPLARPGFTQSGNKLLLSWDWGDKQSPFYKAGSYDYRVYGPDGTLFASGSTPPTVNQAQVDVPRDAAEGTYRAVVRPGQPDGTAVPGEWSPFAELFVEPAQEDGWLASLRNDLAPGPDTGLSARVTQPPLEGILSIPARQTVPLCPAPILQFDAWRSQPAAPSARTVEGYQVSMTKEGTSVVLDWTHIRDGNLPAGFTRIPRRGVLLEPQDLLWGDLISPSAMAQALKPPGRPSGETSGLLVYVYPDLSQVQLCRALAAAGYGALDLALGLLAVSGHYQPTPAPVTPASVAAALVGSWPGPGTPAPADLARVLIPAFKQSGKPLDAARLAQALVAALPLQQVTAAALLPYMLALQPSFPPEDSAPAFARALPGLKAPALAGALRQAYLPETSNLQEYARILAVRGLSAQEAVPFLALDYPLAPPGELAQSLLDSFPSTASSALLLAWCLALADAPVEAAAAALVEVLSGLDAKALAAALKTAYPAPEVEEEVAKLQARGSYAPGALKALTGLFPDLTGTQLGWIALNRFGSTAPDVLSMTYALSGAGAAIESAAVALRRLYPLLTAAQIAAILKQAYLKGENDGQ